MQRAIQHLFDVFNCKAMARNSPTSKSSMETIFPRFGENQQTISIRDVGDPFFKPGMKTLIEQFAFPVLHCFFLSQHVTALAVGLVKRGQSYEGPYDIATHVMTSSWWVIQCMSSTVHVIVAFSQTRVQHTLFCATVYFDLLCVDLQFST